MVKHILKVLLTHILSTITVVAFAQAVPPVIRAKSDKVDIRVGDDFFLKGGWTLEPGKNPDVFSIGSKWPYKSKKVSFITDIDSISLDVEAGHKYDLIILWSEAPCHIQISTLADPVFLNSRAVVLILSALVLYLAVLYYFGKKISGRRLLKTGYWVSILFWVMTFTSGYMHGNYNHFKNTISELGAIGTKSELFTSSFLFVLAALNLLFCIGFYKMSKEKRLALAPSIMSFSMPVSMIWAAIFTLGNEFHSMLGFLPFLTMLATMLSYFLWKTNLHLRTLRIISLVAFMMMMLILTRFIRPFGVDFEGLVQRFFYLGWTIWTIGISFCLSKRSTKE